MSDSELTRRHSRGRSPVRRGGHPPSPLYTQETNDNERAPFSGGFGMPDHHHGPNGDKRDSDRNNKTRKMDVIIIDDNTMPESNAAFVREARDRYKKHCERLGLIIPKNDQDFTDQAVRYLRNRREEKIAEKRGALPVYSSSSNNDRKRRSNSELANLFIPASQRFIADRKNGSDPPSSSSRPFPVITAQDPAVIQSPGGKIDAGNFMNVARKTFPGWKPPEAKQNGPECSNSQPEDKGNFPNAVVAAWNTIWEYNVESHGALTSKNCHLLGLLDKSSSALKAAIDEMEIEKTTLESMSRNFTEACERAVHRLENSINKAGEIQRELTQALAQNMNEPTNTNKQ